MSSFFFGSRFIRCQNAVTLFLILSLLLFSFVPTSSLSFLLPTKKAARTTILYSGNNDNNRVNRIQRNIEEKGREMAKGGGAETAAGAVLGGLLLGPFGALFGANIGANIGRGNAVNNAKTDEMKRLGVTQDMLDMTQEVGTALERAMEGYDATTENVQTLKSLATKLDDETKILYEKAMKAMQADDPNEEEARKYLEKRRTVQEKFKSILIQLADANKRMAVMEENVQTLDLKAKEIETLLTRTIAAKSSSDISATLDLDSSSSAFMLEQEDPLLKKFKELENM